MERVIERDLTEKQRAALLAELKGMPQADIARHLSSNRNAVYKLTYDARKRLRRGLEAAGYGGAEVVVDLTQAEGPGFEVLRPETALGQLRAIGVDQPPHIDGEAEPAWESAPALDVPLTFSGGLAKLGPITIGRAPYFR